MKFCPLVLGMWSVLLLFTYSDGWSLPLLFAHFIPGFHVAADMRGRNTLILQKINGNYIQIIIKYLIILRYILLLL